jgi:hypothetical protein
MGGGHGPPPIVYREGHGQNAYPLFENPRHDIETEALMKSSTRTFLVVLIVITVLSLLLSACGPLDDQGGKSNNGKGNDKENNKDKDKGNGKDKDRNVNADKVTICHKTGSAKNPYVEISISNNAIKDGHGTHEGDLIPAPEGGCPETVAIDVPAK